ncbi:MAG TPA: serine hydrolase [Ottowia sp.]|nr:serine hydrolase [Ottowia sp.]
MQYAVAALADAIAWAQAHETPWARDPADTRQPFGVHVNDPPPYNRTFGPLHPRGPVGGVIWQHGRELAAWGEPQRADQTFSVAKTYLALLAGVAQREGRLADVDRPVAATLPGIGFDSDHNAPITWRHLLEQTSEWEGSLFGLPDTVDRWRKVAHDPRPAEGRKGDARPLCAPGRYWEYNDVRINQLSLALLHLFREPLEDVFRREILRPLQATDPFRWEPYDNAWVEIGGRRLPSVPGGTHWGAGVSISARDQARVGQLLLQDGLHDGQALLPPGWVQRMRTPCDIAPFYGWLVWLNPQRLAFPAADERAFFMQGAGGHMVWMDPALDAVVVTRWLDPVHAPAFVERVVRALGSAAPGGVR